MLYSRWKALSGRDKEKYAKSFDTFLRSAIDRFKNKKHVSIQEHDEKRSDVAAQNMDKCIRQICAACACYQVIMSKNGQSQNLSSEIIVFLKNADQQMLHLSSVETSGSHNKCFDLLVEEVKNKLLDKLKKAGVPQNVELDVKQDESETTINIIHGKSDERPIGIRLVKEHSACGFWLDIAVISKELDLSLGIEVNGPSHYTPQGALNSKSLSRAKLLKEAGGWEMLQYQVNPSVLQTYYIKRKLAIPVLEIIVNKAAEKLAQKVKGQNSIDFWHRSPGAFTGSTTDKIGTVKGASTLRR